MIPFPWAKDVNDDQSGHNLNVEINRYWDDDFMKRTATANQKFLRVEPTYYSLPGWRLISVNTQSRVTTKEHSSGLFWGPYLPYPAPPPFLLRLFFIHACGCS